MRGTKTKENRRYLKAEKPCGKTDHTPKDPDAQVVTKSRSDANNFPPLPGVPSPPVSHSAEVVKLYKSLLNHWWRKYVDSGRKDFNAYDEYHALERFLIGRGMFQLRYNRSSDPESFHLIESVELDIVPGSDGKPVSYRPDRAVSDINEENDNLGAPVGRLIAERGHDFMRGRTATSLTTGESARVESYVLTENKLKDRFMVRLPNGKQTAWNAAYCLLQEIPGERLRPTVE